LCGIQISSFSNKKKNGLVIFYVFHVYYFVKKKRQCSLSNKGISLSFSSIANAGIICQLVLLLLFLLINTENGYSPSENYVTQLGFNSFLFMLLFIFFYKRDYFL